MDRAHALGAELHIHADTINQDVSAMKVRLTLVWHLILGVGHEMSEVRDL